MTLIYKCIYVNKGEGKFSFFLLVVFSPIDNRLTAGALTAHHHTTDEAKCWTFHLFGKQDKITKVFVRIEFLTSPAEGPLTLFGQVKAAARFIRSV